LQVTLAGNNISASVIPIKVNYWQPYKLVGTEGEEVIKNIKNLSKHFNESIF